MSYTLRNLHKWSKTMIKIKVVSFVTFVLTLVTTSTPSLSQSLNKPNTVEFREPIKLVQNTNVFDAWNKYTAVHETLQFTKVYGLLNTAKGEELEKVFEYLISASRQLAQHHNNQANSIERSIPIVQKQNGDVKFLKAMREFSLESSEFYDLFSQYFSQLKLYKKSGNANAIKRLNETLGQLIGTKVKKVSADLKILNNYYNANYASRQLINSFVNRIPNPTFNDEPDLLTIYKNGYNPGGASLECALETYDCTPKYQYLHK